MILLRETKRKLRCIYFIIRFCLSTVSFHAIDLISNATAKNLYLAHYIFRTILVAVRFIKGGKTLAIHKKTCLLHVYDKRTGLRLLSVS